MNESVPSISEAEYQQQHEKLARRLAAALPKEYEGSDEYSLLDHPDSPVDPETLRITEDMRRLNRRFATQEKPE